MDDKEIKVMESRVKAAAEKCGTAKEILKELFPDVFKPSPPEWEDVTDRCSFLKDSQGGPFIVCEGKRFGFLDPDGSFSKRFYEGQNYIYEIRDGGIWRSKSE